MSIRTRFENEANGNLEIAYWILAPASVKMCISAKRREEMIRRMGHFWVLEIQWSGTEITAQGRG